MTAPSPTEVPRGVPLADLHCHAETAALVDRVLARRDDRPEYDWAVALPPLASLPPGIGRLEALNAGLDAERLREHDRDDAVFAARLEAAMEDAAAAGAILFELRVGHATVLRPGFVRMFREAEERVRARHPRFYAEPLVSGIWPTRPGIGEVVEACIAARGEGLAGVDFLSEPYETEEVWPAAYRLAERLAGAGLGVTAHAGEFSSSGLAKALDIPGLTRVGHGVRLAAHPDLLEAVRERVVVECCLTSNVVLGAVESLESHPLRQFVAAGVAITLNTDNPVRTATSIRDEYALAARLGLDTTQLLSITRTAVEVSFTSPERRRVLLATVAEASSAAPPWG